MAVIRPHLDCLILTMPKILPVAPTPGAPRLKAIGEAIGYKIQTVDLNIVLWNQSEKFKRLLDSTETSFFDPVVFPNLFKSEFENFCRQWARDIASSQPRWVGLSVLSYQCELFSAEFCRILRAEFPLVQIVIGGPGASSFGERFKNSGLAEAFVVGEAEEFFLNLLRRDTKFDSMEQAIPNEMIADYSDYDMSLYSDELWQNMIPQESARGLRTLFVTGSTGCVRNCSFCDVRGQWRKFFQRSPQDVVREIEKLNSIYKVKNFFFTDSLMNGDKFKFSQFVDLMIELNEKNDKTLTFEGYMICRSQRDMKPEDFDRYKKAGLRKIYLGVETGSDKVRSDMKKGYSREDLDYFVEQMHRVNIEISLLLMVGFPTETEEDFSETLKMLSFYHQQGFLGPDKIMRTASFNWTTIIPENSPLRKMVDEWQIDMSEGESLWAKKNQFLGKLGQTIIELNSPEMRAFRYKRLVHHLESFGLQLRKVENFLQERENHFKKNKSFYWHLAKANFEKTQREAPLTMGPHQIVEWRREGLREKISSMVFVLYWPPTGELHRLEGLLSDFAERIDGQKTIQELIEEVCNYAGVSPKDWANYFLGNTQNFLSSGILEMKADKEA